MEKIYELIDNRILELLHTQKNTNDAHIYEEYASRIEELVMLKQRVTNEL